MLTATDGGEAMPFLIFQSIGAPELLIIFAIVVVLFGATRIGDIGGAMGRAIRQFRREIKEPEEQEKAGKPREEHTTKAESTEDRPSFKH
jgi:sec-independent protein translocase protein TatA